MNIPHLGPTGIPAEYGGYWLGQHPQHTVSDWQQEVSEGLTRMGYWDWVAYAIDLNRPEISTNTQEH